MKDRKLWEKRLGAMKGYKTAAKEASKMTEGLPDARYTGIISDATMKDSNAGDPMIAVNLKVINDEEYNDENVTSFMNLSDKGTRFTIATLKRLGFELEGDDPSEILDAVEELAKSKMTVTFKVKGGYANIVSPVDVEEGDAPEAEESEDEEESEETEEKEETSGEIAEGSKVSWEKDGETRTGTVVEILEEDNIARIEKEDGKVTRVSTEKLTLVTDEEESEEEESEEEEEVEEDPKEEVEETEEEEEEAPKAKRQAKKEKTNSKSKTKKRRK